MRNITISSYRNKTEKLTFEWPEGLPNTKGGFNHKVVCSVSKPAFPKIMHYRVRWALDTAMHAHKEDVTPTVMNDILKLKNWLRYAPLSVVELREKKNSVSWADQVEVTLDDRMTERMERLEEAEEKAAHLHDDAQDFASAIDRYDAKLMQSRACVIL